MENENKGFTTNEDGSVDIDFGGQKSRYVKESDLLAVKSGKEKGEQSWEAERTKFQTNLAEANRIREETHQQLLQAQAAKEQLAEQFQDYDTHKTRVGELETQLSDVKTKFGTHETELVDRIRQNLISAGANEDSIKDKTLDQLRNLEDAAKLFGKEFKSRPANYDGGKQSPGSGGAAETPMERANRILEEHKEKGHHIGAMQRKA